MSNAKREALIAVLDQHPTLSIAVSGGVDSMVLAYLAHAASRAEVTVVHAVSPAVPAAATERVRTHAARHGWALRIIDAGEMADPAYRANPVDRCFHCKQNLYASIRAMTAGAIASGTNVDDLSDYRPGLEAAHHHHIRHPYVEAEITKRDIYALAAAEGLDDLAALPAQPCLSSRIETGITVDPVTLAFIESAELQLTRLLPGDGSVRCRITAEGVVFECSGPPEGALRDEVERWAAEFCSDAGRPFAGLRAYRRGAAFLRRIAA